MILEIARTRRGILLQTLASSAGLLAALLLEIVVFSALQQRFLSAATFTSVINQIPALTVVAVAMTIVLISGGIDLSVGSLMALTGSFVGILMVDRHWGLAASVIVAVLGATACGMINGAVIVSLKLPAFIVTLGTLQIARGTCFLITNSRTRYIGAAIEPIAAKIDWLGMSPAFLFAMAAVAVGQFVLSRTIFGRYCIAIGSNEAAVRMSGIDPRWTKIAAFGISGFLAGAAGVIESSRLGSSDPNGGGRMELDAIAAAVIGGTSLAGGRGAVISTFFGVLIVAVLKTGLIQVGAGDGTKLVITGLVTVLAVAADSFRAKIPSWGTPTQQDSANPVP
jgi:ribose transport system permease protein